MNIIFISAEMPYPANTGGRIVVYKRLQYLSQYNDIYFYSIVDNMNDFGYRDELQRYCKDVHLYNRNTIKNRLRTLFSLHKGPFACVSRSNNKMKKDILNCYTSNSIDFVMVEFPQMLGVIPQIIFDQNKIILEQHNIEWITMSNIAKSIKNGIKRLVYEFESKRLRMWEEKFYRNNIALFTFVSSDDKMYFQKQYPHAKTYLSPIGSEVDILNDFNIEHNSVMYFGKMSYPPNAEAAKWFAEEVLPLVQKKVNSVKFYIVGKDPLPFLTDLPKKNNHVVVTGTVDTVREYYEKAAVVVVPLSHGGGVKVKVLEALGFGKLVISTAKGIEGTDFKNGKELLIADSKEKMADLIVDVLLNPQNFEEVRKQGINSISTNYTWLAIVDKFQKYLHNLAGLLF